MIRKRKIVLDLGVRAYSIDESPGDGHGASFDFNCRCSMWATTDGGVLLRPCGRRHSEQLARLLNVPARDRGDGYVREA